MLTAESARFAIGSLVLSGTQNFMSVVLTSDSVHYRLELCVSPSMVARYGSVKFVFAGYDTMESVICDVT